MDRTYLRRYMPAHLMAGSAVWWAAIEAFGVADVLAAVSLLVAAGGLGWFTGLLYHRFKGES